MISLTQIGIRFGGTDLFTNLTFTIGNRERIALVGRNGAGKSTLLKIIAGELSPTVGQVVRSADSTVGYLPQVMTVADDTTVLDEVRKVFASTQDLKRRVEELEEQLSRRDDYESDDYLQLVDRYSSLHDRFMLLSSDNQEAETERTLTGLGFRHSDFHRATSEFSGGWRMRIELAKLLLAKPDTLLLDEPTNHLDIESIIWLEQFLKQMSGSAVIVSHDRTFLNHATKRTIELSCQRMTDYKVTYSDYVRLRAERREQQLRAYENQQREIKEAQDFINRFRYKPSKAIQVQQKIKQLEKIVPIEIDEIETAALHLRFPPCQRAGDYPVICDGVGKQYNGIPVFSNVNLTLKRGEKVAFVGKNGEGKTTLVRCIMNDIDDYEGTLKVGHNVQIGYFAQNEAQRLDPTLTVFDTIDRVATGEVRLKIRDLLGAFMFGGEESDKKVSVLSGGERSRLAMLRLLLKPVNLLILDEPTNHLDIHSKNVLKEAINAFDGTAIIVSHDRDFLNGLVSKVYEFRDGKVREYIGGIYDWCEHFTGGQQPATDTQRPAMPQDSTASQSYNERKERQRRRNRLEKKIKDVEKEIEKIERRLHELDTLLEDPANASDMILVNEYTTLKRASEDLLTQWEQLSEDLEKIEV